MRLRTVPPSWLLAAALLAASPAFSQTPPAGQPTAPNPAPGAAEAGDAAGCASTRLPATAGGASVVQATGQGVQPKSWQPMGGDIQFSISSFLPIPDQASVYICFRWKTPGGTGDFVETRPSQLTLSSDRKSLKVTTIVPQLSARPADVQKILPLVPLAEVRILAIDNKQKSVAADASTTMGITYPFWAFAFAILAAVLGFLVLYFCVGRITQEGIRKANPLLRIISTPSGFASLSQLQIIIWTFVVAASAVYVMSLSGELIQITEGTLVLLGIAGAAGLGAKVHTEAQATGAETAATQAEKDRETAKRIAAEKRAAAQAGPNDQQKEAQSKAADEDEAAKASIAQDLRAKANAIKTAPADQVPKWSDLILTYSGTDATPEVDVTRFQMLFFTIITAIFVLTSVVANYVIPEIPAGFVTLMGISNGVYIGSKVVQRS